MKKTRTCTRRGFLEWGGAAAAASAMPLAFTWRSPRARAELRPDQKLLFVVTASGGGSIIDSFLPVTESMAPDATAAESLVVYPDVAVVQPAGSALRVVRNLRLPGPFQSAYDPVDFLTKHYADACVVTVENTSVNHVVAQKRAMTGAGIDGGRTLLEAMAMQWGDGLLLPSTNMAGGGYVEPGDANVPPEARAEIIADPVLFAASTHGYAGLSARPDDASIADARGVRERLDDASPFASRFSTSALRRRYLSLRRDVLPRLESDELIRKLLLVRSADGLPLGDYGIASDPAHDAELARIRELFPDLLTDSLQAQTALAFLLARNGVTSAVAIGPSFAPSFLPDGTIADTPIAFDFSHASHLLAQNVMWSRITRVLDGLVTLLKETPLGAGSMWDRSLVYVATDFGRSKVRPRGSLEFGSGHHLNNGNLLLSPMLKGNRVFGGVDPATCLTYGFDGRTGEPDRAAVMREGHLYSLVCQTMGIDFHGRYDMSGLLR